MDTNRPTTPEGQRRVSATRRWPSGLVGFLPKSSTRHCLKRGLVLRSWSDNLVGILSRVAEGIGPQKPQQPVLHPEDAGATSYPAVPGEIRSCAPHASCSLLPRSRKTPLDDTHHRPQTPAPACGGIVRVCFFRPRPQMSPVRSGV